MCAISVALINCALSRGWDAWASSLVLMRAGAGLC